MKIYIGSDHAGYDLKEKLKIVPEIQKIVRKAISNRINSLYQELINDNTFEKIIEKNIKNYNKLRIFEKKSEYWILFENIFYKKDFYEIKN